MLSLDNVRFCAEECKRQQSGEISVYWMCQALDYALRNVPTTVYVLELAAYVEPVKNAHGFRTVPVTLPSGVVPVTNFYRQLDALLQARWEFRLSAEEAYQEFEKIHPFIDGNGRVGAILYNAWLGFPNPLLTPPKFGE